MHFDSLRSSAAIQTANAGSDSENDSADCCVVARCLCVSSGHCEVGCCIRSIVFIDQKQRKCSKMLLRTVAETVSGTNLSQFLELRLGVFIAAFSIKLCMPL